MNKYANSPNKLQYYYYRYHTEIIALAMRTRQNKAATSVWIALF